MKIKIISKKSFNKKFGTRCYWCIDYEVWEQYFGKTFDVNEFAEDGCARLQVSPRYYIPKDCYRKVKQ